MGTKPQRPRPRQERARQIFEAGCGLIRISGRPWNGMHASHTYGGGFHVTKYAGSPCSVVVDIWPVRQDEVFPDGTPVTDHKVFGCELEADGRIYLRSFRRGPWEDEFLRYASSFLQDSGSVVPIHSRLA